MTPAEKMREAAAKIVEDVASSQIYGGRIGTITPMVAANNVIAAIRALPIPDEATEPTSDILAATYLSGAYDWRKKAERVQAALEKALPIIKNALDVARDAAQFPFGVTKATFAVFDEGDRTLAVIREALGETR